MNSALRSEAVKAILSSCLLALLLFSVAYSAAPKGVIVFGMNSSLKGTGTLYFQPIPNGTKKKLTDVDGRVPEISPDGQYVVFSSGAGGVYICELKENAKAVKIAIGHEAHFWYNPNGKDTWVTFSSLAFRSKASFGKGNTYKIQVDLGNLKAIGQQQEIKFGDKSSHVKGGMSYSGKYMCTAYPDGVVAEVATGKTTQVGRDQRCWPSIAPGAQLEGYMMLETLDHNSFTIGGPGKTTKQIKPNGVAPKTSNGCQSVRWSSHPEWMSYSNNSMDGGKAVIVRFTTGGSIKEKYVVSNDKCFHIYLWVGDAVSTRKNACKNELVVYRQGAADRRARVYSPNGSLIAIANAASLQHNRAMGTYIIEAGNARAKTILHK
jgi:hypothetical protein